jgi:hypothetical protein
MRRRYSALLLGAALLCPGACATTTFTSTWKAPDVQGINPAGKTVAAVFVSRDESKRRAGEDAVAAALTARGAHGVPAYTLLSNERRGDEEAARARLKEAGANGIVVMRVVGMSLDAPASYSDQVPGNKDRAAVVEAQQSYTLVLVETQVYSLDRDKLLWTSTSRTTEPKDLDSLVKEVANATAKEMVKQGLLVRQ